MSRADWQFETLHLSFRLKRRLHSSYFSPIPGPADLPMRVAMQDDPRGTIAEHSPDVIIEEKVFIFISRRSMHTHRSAFKRPDRAAGQLR
jgi:hypothetical protein